MIQTGEVRDAVWAAMCEHGPDILERIGDVPHTPSGALLTEMIAFIALAEARDCNVIIESGRAEGYSTECFARGCELAVHSCDQDVSRITKERDEELRELGVCCEVTSGQLFLPFTLERLKDTMRYPKPRVALFLDGPKGRQAFALAEAYKHDLVFFAVHDLCRRGPSGEVPHAATQYAIAAHPDGFITSLDDEWRRAFAWMDEDKREAGGWLNWGDMTGEAFGIGFFKGEQWLANIADAAVSGKD